MTIRSIYDETTSPSPDGTELLAQHGVLWNIALNEIALTLTNVSGTDTITADVEPEMPATGWAKGMSFKLTAEADNTRAATLNVNGAGDKALVRADNSALAAGDIVGGTTYLLFYDGANVRILGSVAASVSEPVNVWLTFTSSGVFTNSYDDDALIYVQLWAAGGGGKAASCGGGGAYVEGWFRAGDLPASVTVTVPGASAVDEDGGNAAFGDLLIAFGGKSATNGRDGGRSGLNGTTINPLWDGGDGGTISSNDSDTIYGAAGGRVAGTASSQFGGDGGLQGPGEAPGGGGGATGSVGFPGARGECRIRVING
jgi:hypothetical protein